jgi:hypothetical protein
LRALLAVPGIDVNIKDTRGWTAFVWASSKGHVEVIQELLQAGADAEPDYLEFLEEFNPGATKIFNRYYEQRAWMCNLSHDRLYDLLHWLSASVPGAITAGTTSTANPSATVTTTTAASLTDGTGNEIPGFHLHETCTSLFTGACDVADTEILFKTCTRLSALGKQRLLHSLALGFMRGHHCAAGDAQQLDPGIRVALQQAELWTPFLEALAASTTIQEDIDRFQGHGHTLLTQAAQSGNIKVIDILAKLRADIHLPDSKGDTALLAAAKARQWDACACLLQLGAKPNRTDRDGCSSLFHIARAFTEVSDSVQADHLASLIESLLKAGFVFDQANPDTQTRGACPTLADLLCSNPQSLAYLALFEGSEATGANPARTMQFVQAIMANTHRRRTVTTDHTTSAPATISADRA